MKYHSFQNKHFNMDKLYDFKNEKWWITTNYRTATTDLRNEVITIFLWTFWRHSRSSCFFQSFFCWATCHTRCKILFEQLTVRWIIQEPLVLKRPLRVWKFQLINDLILFFEESRCLLDTFFAFEYSESHCSKETIQERSNFDVKNSRHSRMSVANLKPFLGSRQRFFKVSFWCRNVGSIRQSREFWEHRQNAQIIANAIWRAEDPPLHLQVERRQEQWVLKGLFVFNKVSPDIAIGHTNFISSVDQPWRVVNNDICSFDLPRISIWIARMVESGASKTNCWFAVKKLKWVQFKLFFLGSTFRTEI